MSTKPLTKTQMQVLNFMHLYFQENDQLPPPDAMQAHFGWSSPNSVQCVREALERKGWIEKNAAGKYRFTRTREVA